MGSDVLTKRKYVKEKLLTVLLVRLLHLRGGRMTGSVGNTILKSSSMDIVVVKETIYFSDAQMQGVCILPPKT